MEPTSEQRRILESSTGATTLAQFLSVREQAYARYGIRIVPYLISVGGYPDFMGHVIGTFVGSEDSPLHDDWSEFAMVYYPSRRVFLNMATHAPAKGIHHRDAGLARAVLLPSTAWPS